MTPTWYETNTSKRLSRKSFLLLVNQAIEAKSFRFVRQATQAWLALLPGDMEVNYLFAEAQLAEKRNEQACTVLDKLVVLDPEYLPAQKALAKTSRNETDKVKTAKESVYILDGTICEDFTVTEQVRLLRSSREALDRHQYKEANFYLQKVLVLQPENILAALIHMQITCANSNAANVINLASLYHNRWPDCLTFGLYLAEAQLETGDENAAVGLIHKCAANDSAGQIPARIWGQDHPYRQLWPERLEIHFDLPIPADVSARLGWNQLSAGPNFKDEFEPEVPSESPSVENISEVDHTLEGEQKPALIDEATPEQVKERKVHSEGVKAEFQKVAKRLNKPGLTETDGRFPMYVIISTITGLKKQFGTASYKVIDQELRKLSERVKKQHNWGSIVFYPDNSEGLTSLGLSPVDPSDPWKLKLALADLDKMLQTKGAMIGAVLIIGGPEVVPFHHLPNPTDDLDKEILSDNPYGTGDANYFITEWAVGRIPGGTGPDAGLLLSQIRTSMRTPKPSPRPFQWSFVLPGLPIFRGLERFFGSLPVQVKKVNFGYSAEVWRRSSQAVFSPIGKGGTFYTSPPESARSIDTTAMTSAPMGYYNLHGLVDTAEWYGQRDPGLGGAGQEYPVAVTPKDLVQNGSNPGVVFSEACYGGHIASKSESQSLALKFLSVGVTSFVGSTSTSYGSVGMPLIGADLLGNLFWNHMNQGLAAGEALLKAKSGLIAEMNKRQGYLDGEDQKTLISFVLYGDPLASLNPEKSGAKSARLTQLPAAIKTICDREDEIHVPRRISGESLSQVKRVVENYLPGLDAAEIRYSQPHSNCAGTHHHCPTSELGEKSAKLERTGRVVVTISKQVKFEKMTHNHFARVTLDGQGKMVKLSVSR